MKKGPFYTVVFMLVITAAFTAVLAAANQAAAGRVETNRQMRVYRSYLYAFNIPVPAGAGDQEILALYNRFVKPEKAGKMDVLTAYNDSGDVKGYGFTFQGPGLWGTIEGFLAVSRDKTKILGIDFISQSETPGLGARIDETSFKEQFRDVSLGSGPRAISFRPKEPDGQVDAVTGATITSNAVEKMMNEAIQQFRQNSGGES